MRGYLDYTMFRFHPTRSSGQYLENLTNFGRNDAQESSFQSIKSEGIVKKRVSLSDRHIEPLILAIKKRAHRLSPASFVLAKLTHNHGIRTVLKRE